MTLSPYVIYSTCEGNFADHPSRGENNWIQIMEGSFRPALTVSQTMHTNCLSQKGSLWTCWCFIYADVCQEGPTQSKELQLAGESMWRLAPKRKDLTMLCFIFPMTEFLLLSSYAMRWKEMITLGCQRFSQRFSSLTWVVTLSLYVAQSHERCYFLLHSCLCCYFMEYVSESTKYLLNVCH